MIFSAKKKNIRRLAKAFACGYYNATKSLIDECNEDIYYNNFYSGTHSFSSDPIGPIAALNRNGPHLLIAADVSGEVSGKSYLVLSDKEFQILCLKMGKGKDYLYEAKEEFIISLANILSAEVMTIFSEEVKLNLQVHVAIEAISFNGNLISVMYNDFMDLTDMIYINATFFSFDKHPDITPFFIWTIDPKTLLTSQPPK